MAAQDLTWVFSELQGPQMESEASLSPGKRLGMVVEALLS